VGGVLERAEGWEDGKWLSEGRCVGSSYEVFIVSNRTFPHASSHL
jgi:hypothetical protein